jgi:hypothetical protein
MKRITDTISRITLGFVLALIPSCLAFVSPVFAQVTQINVEIDWMADPDHSHAPQQAEIDAVVQMFACHGITLNIDVSNEILRGHIDMIRCDNLADDFFTCEDLYSFWSIKSLNQDHTGGGWHYCVFGHWYNAGTGPGSSGIAEVGGDDLLVTLGTFAGGIGTPWDRAATFAHELGHNLYLRHWTPGSPPSVGNFQPNYASIMSYQYQLSGLRRQLLCLGLADSTSLFKELDYSNGRLPSIDENALSEPVGVGIHNVDWDCDGVLDQVPVGQNVDNQNPWCATSGPQILLRDYDDWSNLVDATLLPTFDPNEALETITCITYSEYERMQAKHLPNPLGCPTGQPNVWTEACVSGLMIWVDASFTGTETGTGDQPFNTLLEAYNSAPQNSVLYLQPGTYTNGGATLVLSKSLTLAGPGGAIVDP